MMLIEKGDVSIDAADDESELMMLMISDSSVSS